MMFDADKCVSIHVGKLNKEACIKLNKSLGSSEEVSLSRQCTKATKKGQ